MLTCLQQVSGCRVHTEGLERLDPCSGVQQSPGCRAVGAWIGAWGAACGALWLEVLRRGRAQNSSWRRVDLGTGVNGAVGGGQLL